MEGTLELRRQANAQPYVRCHSLFVEAAYVFERIRGRHGPRALPAVGGRPLRSRWAAEHGAAASGGDARGRSKSRKTRTGLFSVAVSLTRMLFGAGPAGRAQRQAETG
jgi:hypothetical protein